MAIAASRSQHNKLSMTHDTAATVIDGCGFDPLLLSRIEDAGINASAPPQQRWLDGWLLRFSPGQAKRARCINAVAEGRMPWQQKLGLARDAYRDHRLPLVMRITPFTLPATLDAWLDEAGWPAIDPTVVMVNNDRAWEASRAGGESPGEAEAPSGLAWRQPEAAEFAAGVGGLRGSSAAQIAAHAHRLEHAPVPAVRWGLVRTSDGELQACGQSLQEGDVLGLYDIHTRESARGQGLGTMVCKRLLSQATRLPETAAYLQVDAENFGAQRIYRNLGFRAAYRYHYRELP